MRISANELADLLARERNRERERVVGQLQEAGVPVEIGTFGEVFLHDENDEVSDLVMEAILGAREFDEELTGTGLAARETLAQSNSTIPLQQAKEVFESTGGFSAEVYQGLEQCC